MEFWKKYKHVVIAAVIFAVLALILPENNGLTRTGVYTLSFMVSTIYLWLTVGLGWPSILCIAMAILFQSLGSSSAVFAASLGSLPITYALMVILLNNCLVDLGVIEKIAFWFLTRRFVKGRPWAFVTMFILSGWFIGLFMDPTAIVIVYMAFTKSICDAMGYEQGHKFGTVLAFGSFASISAACGATPIGHVIPTLVMAMAETFTGESVSVAKYSLIGVPVTLLFTIIVILVLRFTTKVDMSKFDSYDAVAVRNAQPKLSGAAKFVSVLFVLVCIAWLMPELKFFGALSTYCNTIGLAGAPAVAVVLLCIIRNKDTGKPIIAFDEAVKKVPWSVLIFVGAVMMMGSMINADATGIRGFLVALFMPLGEVLSPAMIVIVGMLAALIMTNFLSNSVSQTIVFTVFAPILLSQSGSFISVGGFAVLCAIAVQLAIMTPPCSGHSAYCFNSGYVTTKDGWKYGIPITILACVLLSCFAPIASMVM